MMQRVELDELACVRQSTYPIYCLVRPGSAEKRALSLCSKKVRFCKPHIQVVKDSAEICGVLSKQESGLLLLDAKTSREETLRFLDLRDPSKCCAYVVVLAESVDEYNTWIGLGADDMVRWRQFNLDILERFVAFGLRAQKQCQETQRLQRKQNGFFASSNEGTWCLDANTMNVEVSRRWQEMVGLPSTASNKMSFHEWLSFVHSDDRRRILSRIRSCLTKKIPPFHVKYRLAKASEQGESWGSKVQGAYNHEGKCEHVLGWQVSLESKESIYDPLTKLPNRKHWLEQVSATFAKWKEHAKPDFALIYIGLNQFHRLNDTLGFGVGDQLLQQVAERLRTTQRFINTMVEHESQDPWEQPPRFRAQSLPNTSTLLSNTNTLRDIPVSNVKVVANGLQDASMTLHDFSIGEINKSHGARKTFQTLTMGINVPALVARFDGDKFGLLIENVDSREDAILVAQRLQHLLERPFLVEGERIYLSASTGVAHSSSEAKTAEDLLRQAGFAMCKAKEKGATGESVLFSANIHEEATQRLKIETGLREALQRKELALFYQPIVSIHDGSILGFEALLRWEHPTMGWISPGLFVPIAEETGLIVDIGAWALETACKQMQQWRGSLHPDLTVSVNVSGKQLTQPNWNQNVEAALLLSGLPPEALKLEVTESCFVSEHNTEDTLQRLRERGICVQIDDFGTGYSSLSRLQDMPADVVKIDQSFVRDMVERPSSDSIVRAVVKLSQSLGFGVVAEGIETQEQWEHLRSIGVGMGQGYLFGRPIPPELIPTLFAKGAEMERELPRLSPPPKSRVERYSTVETPLPACLLSMP